MNKCKGIYNTGNDCFINSTLQCLAVSPFILSFINYYEAQDIKLIEVIKKYNIASNKSNELKIECEKLVKNKTILNISKEEVEILNYISKNNYVLYIYLSFKKIINNLNDNKIKPLCNSNFVSINKEMSEHFGFNYLFEGDQNDPHELIVYLLDKLHDAKKISVPITPSSTLNKLDRYSQLYFNDYKKRYENNYSLFVKNFYYYILSCVQCSKCKNITDDVSPTDILCVSIPDRFLENSDKIKQYQPDITLINEVTIYDCLNDMFTQEKIEYKCEKCNNDDDNYIEKKIMNTPKTLILKIKRYYTLGNNLVKNNQYIKYPLILNIKPYIIGNVHEKYELYSIINHVGGLNSGHYYSYNKKYNTKTNKFLKQWYCCNDAQVKEISNEDALCSKNAYMLFYQLIVA